MSTSKSRSEKFNPHQEEVASGFPIEPPKPSPAVVSNTFSQINPHKRASHSGPLSDQAEWAKAGKTVEDAPKSTVESDLTTSGLMITRRSLLAEERRERSGPKMMVRFPGSFKERSESLIPQHQKHHEQAAAPRSKGEEKANDTNPVLVSN